MSRPRKKRIEENTQSRCKENKLLFRFHRLILICHHDGILFKVDNFNYEISLSSSLPVNELTGSNLICYSKIGSYLTTNPNNPFNTLHHERKMKEKIMKENTQPSISNHFFQRHSPTLLYLQQRHCKALRLNNVELN